MAPIPPSAMLLVAAFCGATLSADPVAAQAQCSLARTSAACTSLGDCRWCAGGVRSSGSGYCSPRSESCPPAKWRGAGTGKTTSGKGKLIEGLVAATFTPFDENLDIDVAQVEKQAAWLNKTGVKWVFVSGTTGESVKLTLAERMSQAELWIKVAKQYGIKTIIHVGSESIDTARMLAQHAEKSGADAFGAMPPVFFQPSSTEALARTMASVASAAPTLPFLYYHIPSMTHVAFPDGMFGFVQEMDKANVGNFRGVKYTGLYTYPGFMDVAKIINYKGGKYEVLSGRDEMMIEAITAGITGFVGSQYNMVGDLYNAIRAKMASGDVDGARAIQYAGIELISAWQGVPSGVNGCKNVFNCLPAGSGAPVVGDARLPSMPISDDAKEALTKRLGSWCSSGATASDWPNTSAFCKALVGGTESALSL